jgi:hypothetical protein
MWVQQWACWKVSPLKETSAFCDHSDDPQFVIRRERYRLHVCRREKDAPPGGELLLDESREVLQLDGLPLEREMLRIEQELDPIQRILGQMK